MMETAREDVERIYIMDPIGSFLLCRLQIRRRSLQKGAWNILDVKMLTEASQSRTIELEIFGENYDGSDKENETECNVLGMIKNHLACGGNINEEIFREKWKFACTSHPFIFKLARNSSFPLLFWVRSRLNLNTVVMDIFSNEISLAKAFDLGDTCRYTKQGWMLSIATTRRKTGHVTYLLHNILTGARLDLPDIRTCGEKSVFSISSSSPDYVVHVNRKLWGTQAIIHVARPGDETWQVYTKDDCPRGHGYAAVILKENRVYCFDYCEKIIVFDLIERQWTTICGLEEEPRKFFVAEVEGEIVKMCTPREGFDSYKFYRLEMDVVVDRASWVQMTRAQLAQRSWFLDCNGLFSVKGGKEVAYRFRNMDLDSEKRLIVNVEVDDIADGTTKSLLPYPLLVDVVTPSWINLDLTH